MVEVTGARRTKSFYQAQAIMTSQGACPHDSFILGVNRSIIAVHCAHRDKRVEIHKGLLFLLGLFFSYSSFSAPVFDIVEDSSVNYVLQSDGSCTIITSLKQKLSSVIAVQEGQYSTIQFDPAAESVQLLEAYTLTPAGQKIAVPISSVFIRPSQAIQDSPGFTNSKNASIIFPQLQLNAVTYVKWKITKKLFC